MKMVNKSKAQHLLQTLVILWFGCIAAACVNTPPKDNANDNNVDDNNAVLQSLSPQQKMTLLSLLESYYENQQAIDSWKQNQASISRLVELESDLKLLIMQLNSLNQSAQQPEPQTKIQATDKQAGIIPEPPSNSSSNAPKTQPSEEQLSAGNNAALIDGYTIQLTAVYTLAHLRAYWQKVKTSYPVMFSEATPFYEGFSNAKGETVYRLKVGRYQTKADAMKVCREFSLKGGTCFVTSNTNGKPVT